jgi:hypothetical protein
MPPRQTPTRDLIRVVRNSADATRDYFIPRSLAQELNLPTIEVYANTDSVYDPEGRYLHLRSFR